ncbi:hypothetical protein SLEP1_g59748 [Rubroshorea leprosula]|uniref:Secreted peptide n=1 Tax=Rubroshorea leprosula TaxID=152421 RepID=A0AAV5MUD4_9ROSI|nr:hypothetical protein SLEP1_g59748 [Rubroshorea leprosula]
MLASFAASLQLCCLLAALQPLCSPSFAFAFAFVFNLLFMAASFHQHLQLSLLHIFAVI